MPHAAEAALPFHFPGFLKLLLAVAALIALAAPALAGDTVLASRVWPAEEYTRVTIETAQPVKHKFFFVTDPDRLVVDLEGVELGDELRALPAKVGESDPYIRALRVAVNRPNVVRIVFDLRTEVSRRCFCSARAGGRLKHRLVLDLSSIRPDPLLPDSPQPDRIGEIAAAPVYHSPP